MDPEEGCYGTDNGTHSKYVVDKIVLHFGSGLRLRYMVNKYDYAKTDDTAEQPKHITQHFFEAYWLRFEKQKRRTSR